MPSLLDRIRTGFLPEKQPARPFKEQGVGGFIVLGGVLGGQETNYQLMGPQRFRKASDLLANISIIAASLRFSLNLVARPSWRCDPPNDTAEAKAAAEFMEEVLDDVSTSWTRIVRRSAMYRYHGFGINEWVAKKRDDGRIGIAAIEARPQHTIERWDIDENGGVRGVWQRDPQTSREIYLPRPKLIYLVDDTLTDRPDGMGWFRHLVSPANRLKTYLKLEGFGFQRDLTGIPIGRAPIHKLNEMVLAGEITEAQRDSALRGLESFAKLETKTDTTGLILDSKTYPNKTDSGDNASAVPEWGMELLTGEQGSIEELGDAVRRLEFEMALIMGTSSMLTGREGEGSRALSEDQSRNLYLTCNSTLADMAEAFDRDLVGPIWAMNGLSEDLRPKLRAEDAGFKDAEHIARVLRDMASAGAVLAPDDPAIDDLRDLLGIEHAKVMTPEELALMRGQAPEDPEEEVEEEEDDGTGGGGGPRKRPTGGPGRARKYDPDQPRDPGGAGGGQWIKAGTEGSDLSQEEVDDLVRVDNPGGDWLAEQVEDAEARDRKGYRASGAITAHLRQPVMLPTAALDALPGARGEGSLRIPGEHQYDRLLESVESGGFDLSAERSVLVGVDHRGKAWMIEGNTRAAVARAKGIEAIPADVRWFAGGEAFADGDFSPAAVQRMAAEFGRPKRG